MKLFKKILTSIFGVATATAVAATSVAITQNSSTRTDSNTATTKANTLDNGQIQLKFDANGGQLEGLSSLVVDQTTKFSQIQNIPTVTREGVTGQPGWYYEQDGNKVVVTADTMFSSNTTLKANWSLYNVNFNPGEGQWSEGGKEIRTISNTTYIHIDEMKAPIATGQTFVGWYDGDTKVTFPYTVTANKTLTAKFTTNTVTLAFAANEGFFETSVKSKFVKVPYGSTWAELKSLGTYIPTNPSYDGDKLFSTWQINKTDVKDTDTFTSACLINATYTEAITITFDVNTNGGKWADSSTSAKTSTKLKLKENPTFADFKTAAGVTTTTSVTGNYDLLGWFTDAAADTDAIDSSTIITSTTSYTVYAYYKVPHNISFVGTTDGYTVNEEIKTFIKKDSITYTITQNEGYTLDSTMIQVSWNSQTKTKGTDYTFSVTSGTGTLTVPKCPGYDITVSLAPTLNTYTITNSAGAHAAFTVAESGQYKSTVTITPNTSEGYTLTNYVVKKTTGGDVLFTLTEAPYTFTMPACNVTITSAATADSHTITPSATNCTISVNSSAKTDDTVTVSATANTGYTVDKLYVKSTDGTKTAATITGSSGSFTMPAYDVKITNDATAISYGITKSASNCTLSVTKSGTAVTSANYGDTIKVTATADTGYSVGNIYVKKASDDTTYATITSGGTFTMPAYAVKITNAATKISYGISATGTNCTLSVTKSGTAVTKANYGDTITVTATADTGYTVGNISVKNNTTSAVTTITSGGTFTMPASAVTITNAASKTNYTISTTTVTGVTYTVSKTTANYGDSISLSATVSTTGYYLSSLTVKSGSTSVASWTGSNGVKSISSKSFTMPAGNVTITAAVAKNSYTLTAKDAGASGSSSYSSSYCSSTPTLSATTATAGSSVTVTATAKDGYTMSYCGAGSTTSAGSFSGSTCSVTLPYQDTTALTIWAFANFTIDSDNYDNSISYVSFNGQTLSILSTYSSGDMCYGIVNTSSPGSFYGITPTSMGTKKYIQTTYNIYKYVGTVTSTGTTASFTLYKIHTTIKGKGSTLSWYSYTLGS